MLQHSYPALSADLLQHGGAPTLQMMYLEVQPQASLMAFVDDFRIIAYLFFVLTPMALFMHKPAAQPSPAVGH